MMKQKGFTLIEILGVIVVLAVISLITTSIIVNVVKKSRMSVAKNSAMNYLDAVEKYMVYREANSIKYPNIIEASSLYQVSTKTYTVPDGKTAVDGKNMNDILSNTIKGKKPTEGIVELNDKYRVIAAEMIVNGYKVVCTSSTHCIVEGKANVTEEKIDAKDVGISIEGMSQDNVADALDYLYERVN